MTCSSTEPQFGRLNNETDNLFNRQFDDSQNHYHRSRRHEARSGQIAETPSTVLNVLIHGNLLLDLPIGLDANLTDIHDALRHGDEKLRCDWKFEEAQVAGFAAHAARSVHAAGHRVFLSAVVPLPLPKLFKEFFEEVDADTQHVVGVPGTTPASLYLRCNDGHLLFPRRGVQIEASAPLATDWLDRFDVVMAQIRDPQARKEFTQMVANRHGGESSTATVAVCGRGDWDQSDIQQFKDSRCWLFFNENESLSVARNTNPARLSLNAVDDAVRELGQQLGDVRLVTSLGADGALYLNGHAGIQRFGTHSAPGARPGAGDTLIAVTAINSAAGIEDEESLRRGVAAATSYVVGV